MMPYFQICCTTWL